MFINPITGQPYERDPVVHLIETQHTIGPTATATTMCGRRGEAVIVVAHAVHSHYAICPGCHSRGGGHPPAPRRRTSPFRLRWPGRRRRR